MITQYKYRFKTKEEFVKEFGKNWRNVVRLGWNSDMNIIMGTIYPYDIKKEDRSLPRHHFYLHDNPCLPSSCGVSWDMLTENIIIPNYEPIKLIRD